MQDPDSQSHLRGIETNAGAEWMAHAMLSQSHLRGIETTGPYKGHDRPFLPPKRTIEELKLSL